MILILCSPQAVKGEEAVSAKNFASCEFFGVKVFVHIRYAPHSMPCPAPQPVTPSAPFRAGDASQQQYQDKAADGHQPEQQPFPMIPQAIGVFSPVRHGLLRMDNREVLRVLIPLNGCLGSRTRKILNPPISLRVLEKFLSECRDQKLCLADRTGKAGHLSRAAHPPATATPLAISRLSLARPSSGRDV